MDKVLIIVNPSSGRKNSLEFSEKIKESLEQKDVLTYIFQTTGKDDFRKLTLNYMKKGVNTIFILGGDGTISKYVNQIAELKDRPRIILLPLGTTNNLARALNTELNETKLFNKIEEFKFTEKKIDIGKINDKYFISTVSAGSIPEVAWEADDEIKEKFGPFGYIIEGLDVIRNEEGFQLSIEIDHHSYEFKDVFLVVVGLSNSVFGIPTFFNNASVDDGKMHMLILKKDSLINEVSSLARQIVDRTRDTHNYSDDESTIFSKSFEKGRFISPSEFHFAVDGEKGPSFPVNLEIFPKHLIFLVPEEDK